jgi:hypothetical protein
MVKDIEHQGLRYYLSSFLSALVHFASKWNTKDKTKWRIVRRPCIDVTINDEFFGVSVLFRPFHCFSFSSTFILLFWINNNCISNFFRLFKKMQRSYYYRRNGQQWSHVTVCRIFRLFFLVFVKFHQTCVLLKKYGYLDLFECCLFFFC